MSVKDAKREAQMVLRKEVSPGLLQSADQWRVVDRFDTSYYNGLDVRVMLGDYVLTDVVGLSYEVVEQATPLYGYASYTFNRVVRGSRLIRGQFTINFKQSGYIVWVVNRYYALMKRELDVGQERYSHALESLLSGETNQQAIRQDLKKAVEEDLKYRNGSVSLYISKLRTHFWGESSTGSDMSSSFTPLFQHGDFPLRLFIAYGDPQLKDSRGVLLQRPSLRMTDERPVSNIPITQRAELFQAEELVEVHILGYSKAVDDSGRNLLEQYQFLARDIVFWQR